MKITLNNLKIRCSLSHLWMTKIRRTLTLVIALAFLTPLNSEAAFTIQYSLFYNTWDDDVDDFSYSRMNNAIFVGASFDRKNKLYIGPSYHLYSKTHQEGTGGTPSEFSVSAFGASMVYFFDEGLRWKTQLTYNFAVSGTRTVAGENQEIEGSGYEAGFGFQQPLTRNFWLGATLNYQSITISEYKVDTTATEGSESYTSIVPMINMNLFFQ